MPMSFEEWRVKADQFPSLGDAERWRAENGVEVEGLPLPESSKRWRGQLADAPAPGGALTAVTSPATAAATDDPARAEERALLTQLQALPGQREALRKRQFEEGQQRIAQMYGGPSQSQQLFSLSQALLSPRPYKGFAGTMHNITNAFASIENADEEARRKRLEAEQQLQQAYQTGNMDDELKSLQLRYQLVKEANDRAAEIARAEKRRTGFNPISGKLQYMDTGEDVGPPPPAVGEVRDGYRYAGGDPADENNWIKVR